MPAEEPQQSQTEPNKPVHWQLAVLCIVLGLLCPVLPFIARQLEPDVFSAFSRPINLFSLCMTFGLFLTAVGGWASGKWRGWTFGGAAATVVALFLLLQFFTPPVDTGREKGMVASISGVSEDASSGLYSAITSIEVLEESGTQLFVAPNRRLKHADVLIETSNLGTHCLAFVFAPSQQSESGEQESESVEAAAEAVAVKIPSDFFRQSMKSASKQKKIRHRVKLFYHHRTRTLLRSNPATMGSGEPLNVPGVCSGISVSQDNIAYRPNIFWGWVSSAFAASQNSALIRQLISKDALIRRAAREKIAAKGPEILGELFNSVPNARSRNRYRYALGAATALTKMIASDFDIVEIRKELKPEHVALLVDLMADRDETMREWAAAAVVGLKDERAVEPLLVTLRDGTVSRDGKYEAALALLATAPTYPKHVQQRIASQTVAQLPLLEPRTALLLKQLPTVKTAETKRGWVYLGTQFGDKWSERHFSWPGDASAAPVNGTVLNATSNVNLRAGHIRFSLDKGWQNSDVLAIVSRGQRVTVREVKEVAPGFYWAEVELRS